MKLSHRNLTAFRGGAAILLLVSAAAPAEIVTWDVDTANSYIRLAVPDQVVNVPDLGDVTIRLRDAGSSSSWSDTGGRQAAIGGQFMTDYANFTTIQFLPGSTSLVALEQTNLRPNPAQWDQANAVYTGTGTAPAALGARIRATYILTFDVAFMALRQMSFEIASDPIPLTPAGDYLGGQTLFGIADALIDVDGLELPLSLGQPVPDLFHEPLGMLQEVNTSGGTVENLGGRQRKLTYRLHAPVMLQFDTIAMTGSADGQIVAYATIASQSIPFDYSDDGDVDRQDENVLLTCVTGPRLTARPPACTQLQFNMSDADQDGDVDQVDFAAFQACFSGQNRAAAPNCAP